MTVPSTLPDGDPQPSDGALPADVRAGVGSRPFSVYIHVPYCATRCGYCDFNTYTASELGGGASQASYAGDAIAELRLARGVLGDVDLPVQTVFFGGGTPTLLPVADLAAMLTAVRDLFGLARDAEVTTEANPESVDAESLAALHDAGFTRISLGMQSVRPHVLAVLDRVHTPGTPARRVAEARAVGFEHVSLDLIYGTPGESDDDWRASLDAAIAAEPDHISAYSLIVEDGTRLAGRVARGELPRPDDDVLADRYLIADEMLRSAGYGWYEVSNWARPGGECPAQLGVLAKLQLVGCWARRPQSRRGSALVEREASDGLRVASLCRRQPRLRARNVLTIRCGGSSGSFCSCGSRKGST